MSSPGSHYNFGWETFTDKIISIISDKKSMLEKIDSFTKDLKRGTVS